MLWWAWLACSTPGVPVNDQVVAAGCGTCVFAMEDVKGCFWAVEIDGQHYPVSGQHPPDDAETAHLPDGMCSMSRQARVTGEIRPDGRFLASRFELLPLTTPPKAAAGHVH